MSDTDAALKRLPRWPASDVKKRGWRGLMRTLRDEGTVVVTNHDEPEAVVVPTSRYLDLLAAEERADIKTKADLDALRRRFDERLASLREPDAGSRLRSVMRGPARLRGKVKAGTGH